MKNPENNYLFIAAACISQSTHIRLKMPHLQHQVAWSWSLLNMAANFRRKYIEYKKQGQGDLFA